MISPKTGMHYFIFLVPMTKLVFFSRSQKSDKNSYLCCKISGDSFKETFLTRKEVFKNNNKKISQNSFFDAIISYQFLPNLEKRKFKFKV